MIGQLVLFGANRCNCHSLCHTSCHVVQGELQAKSKRFRSDFSRRSQWSSGIPWRNVMYTLCPNCVHLSILALGKSQTERKLVSEPHNAWNAVSFVTKLSRVFGWSFGFVAFDKNPPKTGKNWPMSCVCSLNWWNSFLGSNCWIFTLLSGRSHNSDYVLWREGETASPGMKQLAGELLYMFLKSQRKPGSKCLHVRLFPGM